MIGNADDLNVFGIESGYAFYNDLYFNPYNDMTLDVSGGYETLGSLKHITGDPIMTFNLSSREPNGKCDIRAEGLKSEEWYRLQFGGNLVETPGGMSHGETGEDGVIEFTEASIPNG